jgi:hypothetical protein
MPSKKVTDLTELATGASGDKFLVVDVSDTTDGASGTSKWIDWDNLPAGGGAGGDSWSDPVDADIVPDADGTRDLGSSASRFAETHTDSLDINGTTVTAINDEDDMSSDSASALATQQSIKAYVDTYRSESIIVAIGDETTAITTGTAKVTFRMPYAFTLTAVRASLTSAGGTSGTTTFDINENGTTILSTKLTIDAGEKTSTTAATAAVISDASLADDSEITIDVDAVSGDADEAGAKVTLIGYKA